MIAKLKGRNVITLDMDGTLYDPWLCCGYSGISHGADDDCTHVRGDTLDRVLYLAAARDAVVVVLSYRAGFEKQTRAWLDKVGLKPAAVFVPGSADTSELYRLVDYKPATPTVPAGGPIRHPQAMYKGRVISALHQYGCTVVAALDDHPDVIATALDHGALSAELVPHARKLTPAEWSRGYAEGATKRPKFSSVWVRPLGALTPPKLSSFKSIPNEYDDSEYGLTDADEAWLNEYVKGSWGSSSKNRRRRKGR